jgi:hypothetical protein
MAACSSRRSGCLDRGRTTVPAQALATTRTMASAVAGRMVTKAKLAGKQSAGGDRKGIAAYDDVCGYYSKKGH